MLEDLDANDQVPDVPQGLDRRSIDRLGGNKADELERDRISGFWVQLAESVAKDEGAGASERWVSGAPSAQLSSAQLGGHPQLAPDGTTIRHDEKVARQRGKDVETYR